jgi:cytochrome c oxidase subunit 2
MPIALRVVSEERYNAWLAEAKTKFARIEGASDVKLAAAR